MNGMAAAVLGFAGYVLRVVAVMLIAYAGTCACFMAGSRPGDEFRDPNGWSQVLIFLPIGVAVWVAGGWLIRRSKPAKPAEPVRTDD